ncbi:MAG: aminodeoxychorismate/anthranilate synthase component II [Aliiglaciecola sp.]
MLLLIDNYDSFTHNLARYFRELGVEVSVIRNDKINCDDIEKLKPRYLVISPGPCTPNEAGMTLPIIQRFAGRIPLLGVCLGHQAIAQSFGAKIIVAQHIMHGKTSWLKHSHSELFANVPHPFEATRYHSLLIEPDTLHAEFDVTAWCDEFSVKEIMAIEHQTLPIMGVQFHPESLLTVSGHQILNNYLTIADNWHNGCVNRLST